MSGENENDVLKRAHEIFYHDHKKKFTLEHAWKELWNDQKWCDLSLTKIDGSCKRRSDIPTYPANIFRRRFRMKKSLFLHIVDRLSNEIRFFQQNKDARGRPGLSALQKCTAAIRILAYGISADAVDEYLRLGEITARACLINFVVISIINLFGDEYLRRPTPEDLQWLLDVGEQRGLPGMIVCIDCMHWEWKNCPTAWKGQYSRGSGKPTIVLEAVASYDLWI